MWLIIKLLEALLGRFKSKDAHTLFDEVLISEYLQTQKEYLLTILYPRYSFKIYGTCITVFDKIQATQDSM